MSSIDDQVKTEVDGLARMAKRLGLKGTQAEKYVREHMEKLGYAARTHVTYERKAEGGTRGSGGFLGGLFSGSGDDSGGDDDL